MKRILYLIAVTCVVPGGFVGGQEIVYGTGGGGTGTKKSPEGARPPAVLIDGPAGTRVWVDFFYRGEVPCEVSITRRAYVLLRYGLYCVDAIVEPGERKVEYHFDGKRHYVNGKEYESRDITLFAEDPGGISYVFTTGGRDISTYDFKDRILTLQSVPAGRLPDKTFCLVVTLLRRPFEKVRGIDSILSKAGKVSVLCLFDIVVRHQGGMETESPLFRQAYVGSDYTKNLFGVEAVRVLRWQTGKRHIPRDAFWGGLHSLNVSGSIYLEDVDFLKDANELEYVTFSRCVSLRSIGPIREMRKLSGLSLEGCTGLRTLLPLVESKSLGKIEYLYLPPTVDDAELGRLCMFGKSIRYLRLVGASQITDISPIARLKHLERLTIERCPGVKSLAGLAGLRSLQYLYLKDLAHLSDIKAIKGKMFRRLQIQGCPLLKGDERKQEEGVTR